MPAMKRAIAVAQFSGVTGVVEGKKCPDIYSKINPQPDQKAVPARAAAIASPVKNTETLSSGCFNTAFRSQMT